MYVCMYVYIYVHTFISYIHTYIYAYMEIHSCIHILYMRMNCRFSNFFSHSSREYGVDGAADLSMAMIFCFSDLQSIGLDPMYVWRTAMSTLEGVESGSQIRREETPPNGVNLEETTLTGTVFSV